MREGEELVDEWAMRLLSDVEKGVSAIFFCFLYMSQMLTALHSVLKFLLCK